MIKAHMEFTVKHVMTVPMEGVTRDMLDDTLKHETAEKMRQEFSEAGREIVDIDITWVEEF